MPIELEVFNVSSNRVVEESVRVVVFTFTPEGEVIYLDTLRFVGRTVYPPPNFHVIGFDVHYAGEVFAGGVAVVGKDTFVRLEVYDITTDTSVVRLTSENIGILRDEGGYRIVEVFFLENTANMAYRGPAVRVKLPPFATAAEVNTGKEDLLVRKGEAVITPLLPPGKGSVALTYLVPKEGFGFEREGAENYRLIADTLTPLNEVKADFVGYEEFEGERVRIWEGRGRISFFVGIPPHKREAFYYVLGALFVIIGAGLVGMLFGGRRRSS